MHFLHRCSTILFSILGLTFVGAYILLRNDIGGAWPLWWLQVADLPLLLTGITYGSIGIERSLQSPSAPSRLLLYIIFIPAGVCFLFFVTMNFWPAIQSVVSSQ